METNAIENSVSCDKSQDQQRLPISVNETQQSTHWLLLH